VTTGRHVRHVQGYPGAEWKEWTMADSKSTQQTTEEHPGQTLTTTDHDVIRD
jgi:hypothetical protein